MSTERLRCLGNDPSHQPGRDTEGGGQLSRTSQETLSAATDSLSLGW